MKKPEVVDLINLKRSDAFSQAIATEQSRSDVMLKKTFSISQWHLNKINKLALKMSQERSKPVPGSEALRLMIEQYKEGDTK